MGEVHRDRDDAVEGVGEVHGREGDPLPRRVGRPGQEPGAGRVGRVHLEGGHRAVGHGLPAQDLGTDPTDHQARERHAVGDDQDVGPGPVARAPPAQVGHDPGQGGVGAGQVVARTHAAGGARVPSGQDRRQVRARGQGGEHDLVRPRLVDAVVVLPQPRQHGAGDVLAPGQEQVRGLQDPPLGTGVGVHEGHLAQVGPHRQGPLTPLGGQGRVRTALRAVLLVEDGTTVADEVEGGH